MTKHAIYEYKVVPAPTRGQKGKGVKGADGRFANALQGQMNALAAEGWQFLRSETLPNEERSGLTGSATTFRSVMVFQRPAAEDPSAFLPEIAAVPELPAPDETTQDDKTLVLAEDDKTGASAAKDPDEGEMVDDISVALQDRAKTLEQD